jgi:hypothetical protein
MLDWLIVGGIQETHYVQPNRPGLVGLQGG